MTKAQSRNRAMGMMNLAIIAVSAASALAAVPAWAEERLISQNYIRQLRGDESMELLRELNLFSRGRINSVILIASARDGRGAIEISADGMELSTTRVEPMMTSIQIPVGRDLGRDLRSLSLRTRGAVTLAMVGVTMDDDYRTGSPMPPIDDRRGRDDRGPRPIPGPGYGTEYRVSQPEFNAMIKEMNREPFDSQKTEVLKLYVTYWQGRELSMSQMGEVVRNFSFDDGRLEALRFLKPITRIDITQISSILDRFSFSSNREQARQILMAR